MADSAIALSPSRSQRDLASRVLEGAFVVLLLLVYVGLAPFATRDPHVLATGETLTAGEGDLIRQISYLAVFLVIAASAMEKASWRAIDAVPISLAALLLWCALTALWAQEPDITIRRAGLEVVVVLSVMLSVQGLGPERSLRLLRHVLALVLIVNWLSIPFIHNAIHQPGEVDPGIVGDWRGLYFHKNITGAVCALSAMVFLHYALRYRSWTDWALLVGALGFLVMTRSKSSMALLPLALGLAGIYRLSMRNARDRMIAIVVLLLVVLCGAVVLLANADAVMRVLSDPAEFTGRAAIWQAEIAYIRDHPLLGSGFGSFADTGALSPLHNYVSENWVQVISHGHNGYLQLMMTTGMIGFALAAIALFAVPAIGFWRTGGMDPDLKALLFAFFAFFIFHNLTESDFLESDGASWVAYLMMLAALRTETLAPRRLAP